MLSLLKYPRQNRVERLLEMGDYRRSLAGTPTQPSMLGSSPSGASTRNSSAYSPDIDSLNTKIAKERSALVVDDVADVTELLSVLLTHAGYRVVTAASAAQALAAARAQQFDVVISDIGMPDMNGYQLVREMRLLPGYQSVPMVAVTGYSMFDDRERSTTAGFNAHMTKPIDPRALLDLIEQL